MPLTKHPRGSEEGNRWSRTGREILTGVTRQLIDVTEPKPEQIDMRDIALSLSQQVRFTGHCPLRPSIAAHSLACEYIAGVLLAADPWRALADHTAPRRAALMHDAAEYLVSDINGAVKREMRPELRGVAARNSARTHGTSKFDVLEALAQAAIVERYGCSVAGHEELIHGVDCLSCAYEMAWGGWCADARPPAWMGEAPHRMRLADIYAGGPRHHELLFLDRAHELGMV